MSVRLQTRSLLASGPGLARLSPWSGGGTLASLFGADLVCDLHADFGIAFGGALARTAGTGTMVYAIAGSPASRAGLRLEVEAGATTFRYSGDGGSTWIQSGVSIAAGDVALQGALTGVTLTIPGTGTNVAGDVHQATVAAWLDQSPYANDFVNGTAAQQPAYEYAGFNSRGSLLLDGIDDILRNTTLQDFLDGASTPVAVLWAAQQVSDTTDCHWSFGATSGTTNFYGFDYIATTDQWQFDKIDGTAGDASITSPAASANLNRHVFVANNPGTAQELYVDNSAATLSGSLTAGSVALTRCAIGGRWLNADSLQANLRIRRFAVVKRALTAPEIAAAYAILLSEAPP